MTIRPASRGDFPAIARLLRQPIRLSYPAALPTVRLHSGMGHAALAVPADVAKLSPRQNVCCGPISPYQHGHLAFKPAGDHALHNVLLHEEEHHHRR